VVCLVLFKMDVPIVLPTDLYMVFR